MTAPGQLARPGSLQPVERYTALFADRTAATYWAYRP